MSLSKAIFRSGRRKDDNQKFWYSLTLLCKEAKLTLWGSQALFFSTQCTAGSTKIICVNYLASNDFNPNTGENDGYKVVESKDEEFISCCMIYNPTFKTQVKPALLSSCKSFLSFQNHIKKEVKVEKEKNGLNETVYTTQVYTQYTQHLKDKSEIKIYSPMVFNIFATADEEAILNMIKTCENCGRYASKRDNNCKLCTNGKFILTWKAKLRIGDATSSMIVSLSKEITDLFGYAPNEQLSESSNFKKMNEKMKKILGVYLKFTIHLNCETGNAIIVDISQNAKLSI